MTPKKPFYFFLYFPKRKKKIRVSNIDQLKECIFLIITLVCYIFINEFKFFHIIIRFSEYFILYRKKKTSVFLFFLLVIEKSFWFLKIWVGWLIIYILYVYTDILTFMFIANIHEVKLYFSFLSANMREGSLSLKTIQTPFYNNPVWFFG